jgi:diketogulonate reductase-like aldo/keto reductase
VAAAHELEHAPAVVQPHPTALACARRGISYLAYAPLAGPSGAVLAAALAVARRRHASVQRVMLAWLREQAPGLVPLVGASRPASILDSADLLDLAGHELAGLSAARLRGLHEFTGNPRFTPPWLGSSQREVTTFPRV